jgi:glycosyltransferase involved in cell wall biosynthesis
LLTPAASPSVGGNTVTVERIASGLRARGAEVGVWDVSAIPPTTVEAAVEAFEPAIVHAFHAYRAGPLALRLARRREVPLVVTLTGTDANHDLLDPERAPLVRRVLEGAAAVVVFHPTIAERVAGVLPDLGPRLIPIAQGTLVSDQGSFELAAQWSLPAGAVVFGFPLGIRPVKNPRFPLGPLGRLVARHPTLRLLYVGPQLHAEESQALEHALATRPWARYLGVVPHAQMGALLRQIDVVLNCSISEGGMANTLLEAMALGRAVLASDIAGNRSLVEDGVTGLLFADERQFEVAAERLIVDAGLRSRLGSTARARVHGLYPPQREIDEHLELYRRLVPVLSGCSGGSTRAPGSA